MIGERLAAAAAASALLFVLAHQPNTLHAPIFAGTCFIAGVALAIGIRRTGQIWWSAAVHTGWNWSWSSIFSATDSGVKTESRLFGLSLHGHALWTGGSIGPENSIFGLIAMSAILGFAFLAPENPKTPPFQSCNDRSAKASAQDTTSTV